MTKDSIATKETEVEDTSQGDMFQDGQEAIARGGVATPFPWKLHEMLDDVKKEGKEHIVSWQAHGRSFTVHKPKDFVEKIMPTYFNQTKYASFQRQLNLYGFCRLTQGPDKGAYFHKCFVRGEQGLCRGMVRRKIKGTKVRRTLAPEEEPNFYSPEWGKRKFPDQPKFCSIPVSAPVAPLRIRTMSVLQSALSTFDLSEIGKNSTHHRAPQLVSEESSSDSDDSCETEEDRLCQSHSRSLTPKAMEVQRLGSISCPSRPISTKAGDLLYFEGRPFHYLEHLDQLPPLPKMSRASSYPTESIRTVLSHPLAGHGTFSYSGLV